MTWRNSPSVNHYHRCRSSRCTFPPRQALPACKDGSTRTMNGVSSNTATTSVSMKSPMLNGHLFGRGALRPDPAGLWTSSGMQISRTNDGISNTWLYAADEGYENHPVTHVGFANAAKFANWMTSDSISEGIYHRLNTNKYYTTRGYKRHRRNLESGRGRRCGLPTLNEWHGAAYFYPSDYSHMWVPGHSGNALPIRQLGWTQWSHVDLPDLERTTKTLTVAARMLQ